MYFHHTHNCKWIATKINRIHHWWMHGWKTTSTWCFNNSCKLIALESHRGCSCIIAIGLHKLHTYMIPQMVNCVHCNSCDLSNDTCDIEICWVAMKLQGIVIHHMWRCVIKDKITIDLDAILNCTLFLISYTLMNKKLSYFEIWLIKSLYI